MSQGSDAVAPRSVESESAESAGSGSGRVGSPLSWRAEWMRQLRRRRTQWVFGITLVLPLIIVAAFSLNDSNNEAGGAPSGDPGAQMAQIATSSGANFTVFTLMVSSGLLLYLVAALFAGDPVPSEASWSSLRYLLTAPVSRTRLLTSKIVVGCAYLVVQVVVLVAWTLLVGVVFYGTGPLSLLTGGELGWEVFGPRLLVAMAYVVVTVLPIGAAAFWVGVRTDAPLAAVGGAVLILIVAGILDAIRALGVWRHALPGHYLYSWLELLAPTVSWVEMQRGVAWSLLYTVVFLFLAYRHFLTKNIVS